LEARAAELEADWLADIGLTAEQAALGYDEDGRWTRPTGDDEDPEPPTPAAPAVAVRCAVCEDTGAVVAVSTLRPDLTYRRPCPACRGKGSIPTCAYMRCRRPAA
jgi:hypothetical protein